MLFYLFEETKVSRKSYFGKFKGVFDPSMDFYFFMWERREREGGGSREAGGWA